MDTAPRESAPPPAGSACAYPWQQMIIDLTGEVVPCCFWSGYGNTGKPLGNTNEHSLDEIWNGPAYRELRRRNASGDLAGSPCHQCVAWRWAGGRYPGFSWPADFAPETGRCWIALIPEGFRAAAAGRGEPVLLHEDGAPLPRPDAVHDEIRAHGEGRYSVWGRNLYFSSSDGSDPVTNGRRYELRCGDLAAPLAGLAREAPSGRNLLTAYDEYRRGATELTARPSMLSFIGTADCNIDCPACSQNTVRLLRVQHRAATEPDVLAHVPYLHQFIWHGGEPWLIRGFRAFVDGFRAEDNPNLTFGFTSNGTLLDAGELAKLEKFPRLNASISMDSFVPATFEAIREGARFETVLANVLRAVARNDAPRRVMSVGLIVVKSNMLELPFNLRFAMEHGIGLNLSPVVVYPVTERLDVFRDFHAQTHGWRQALEQARAVVAEARAAGRPALERVDPSGMLDVLEGILDAAARRHAEVLPLRVVVTDPHGALPAMRRPGLIIARHDDSEHPLGYLELPAPGEYQVLLPRDGLSGPHEVNWFLVHDLLEPMGVIDKDIFFDSRLRPAAAGGWREAPSELRLAMPPFATPPRPRNARRASGGLATPDGRHVLTPDELLAAYVGLVNREALSGCGVQGRELPEALIQRRADEQRRERYAAFRSLPG